MPRENKRWSRRPQQLSGLSLCGAQLNMARCLCREKVGKDRPGMGHLKSITQCHKANRERGQSPPRLAWSTTWQMQTAIQEAIVFNKKKRAGRRKIHIHACQNRQTRAETILKRTKVLKSYVVYQQLPALEVKHTSRTNSQRERGGLWLPGANQEGELEEGGQRHKLAVVR